MKKLNHGPARSACVRQATLSRATACLLSRGLLTGSLLSGGLVTGAGCGASANEPANTPVETTTSAKLTANDKYDRAKDPSASNASGGTTEVHPEVTIASPASATIDVVPQRDSTLNDGQIAAIASDVDQGEIAAGKLALARGQNAQIKSFAQHMVTAHTAVDSQLLALTKAQNITLTDSVTGTKVNADNESLKQSLLGQSGGDFDRTYIAAQLKGHQDVLDLLDTKLIPSAQNPQLKAALIATRAKVVDHVAMAKAAQSSLGMH